MNLNSDFSQRLVIQADNQPWSPSPSIGVEQKILEQEGAKGARTTTIMRYAAGANAPSHAHDLGVELFVLEGCFQR
jgi:anti-sigma factor ChrR (cupin superfamily)